MKTRFTDILKKVISLRIPSFTRLLQQPNNQTGGGNAATTPPAAGPSQSTPFNPSEQQTMDSILRGNEDEHKSTQFVQMDPNTMRVTDESVEHFSFGNKLISDTTHRKVLTAEGRFVDSKDIKAICDECKRLMAQPFYCSIPGCGKSLCRSHAIEIQKGTYACKLCLEKLEFDRNLWNEFDASED